MPLGHPYRNRTAGGGFVWTPGHGLVLTGLVAGGGNGDAAAEQVLRSCGAVIAESVCVRCAMTHPVIHLMSRPMYHWMTRLMRPLMTRLMHLTTGVGSEMAACDERP